MTEVTSSAGDKSETATQGASRSALISGLAISILLAGFLAPDTRISIGATVLGAALVVWAMFLRLRPRSPEPVERGPELKDLIFHDERAVFVTATSGEVLTRNAAAREMFGSGGGDVLETVISGAIPNANALVFRMQSKASRQNSAREETAARSNRHLVSVHKLPNNRFLWALEETNEQGATGRSIDKISLPMMTVGSSGTILFMNEAMRALVGRRIKSVNLLFAAIPEVSGEVHSIKTPDGVVDVQVILIPGSGGRTEYFLAPVDEAQKMMQSASLEMLEDFPVALLKIRPDGAVDEANRMARMLLGVDIKVPTELTDLVEGLGRPISDWLTEAAEGRALHKPEILKARSEGSETYLQITLGRVVGENGISLMAMITDATELKTLEAQFVQSQKMQAIGQLAGGVAHDFNNLLTAISGHCDLLMLRHDPGDPDFGDLEQINQNANRAASLVGQLLAFSRKQNLQLEVLDMRDTLSDLTHLLNRLVGAQITLNLSHDPQLMSVRADRRQLEQVIMNLVVNSRDAMEGGGGEIAVETRNVRLQSDLKRDRAVVPRGNYVLVKVRDDGSGIPKDKLPKIFEPFFTIKRTGEGTGLGLSTAYGIIKQSGGFIFVDSELGKGTEFSIFFPTFDRPVAVDDVASDIPKLTELGPIDGVVLLVEDEAPVRAFASRALKLRGFEVIEAECAEEALVLLEDKNLVVDIVVTDVVMPGLDGPTWVRQARVSRPDMRVIFMSGYAEENFNSDKSEIPNSTFLPKPFSLNELTSTVQGQLAEAAA